MSKARGKSGPLFHFDVHDDVRLTNDARVEKDEVRLFFCPSLSLVRHHSPPPPPPPPPLAQSHPGKVISRSWYEANKHIFPASRWEVVRVCSVVWSSLPSCLTRCVWDSMTPPFAARSTPSMATRSKRRRKGNDSADSADRDRDNYRGITHGRERDRETYTEIEIHR